MSDEQPVEHNIEHGDTPTESDHDGHSEPDTHATDEPDSSETQPETTPEDTDDTTDKEMPEAVHKILVATLTTELNNHHAGFGPAALELCGYRLDEFITDDGEIAGDALRQAVDDVKERLQLTPTHGVLPKVNFRESAKPGTTWASALRNNY
ncbi:hypothetical protein [Corynebacterium parakroppenstedtii]|uniref:hypothetical protein n=1 Tax=Corynebacterium parakroppenstedtii TaxID=2828363 RepID=UPI001C8D2B18|nr:hypothetical protein [Corynebacterium parakroppenstedtii]MBY0797271.1 hypothetical protein [Corynebacterium parakroppenstedtii]